MFEVLFSMIKEEWRIHSSIFGSIMFAFFPIILMIFSFAGSLLVPIFIEILPLKQILLLSHFSFVLLGLSVGAFGLLGREAMNRRFGHASLIAYSSRNLPISERRILLNFYIKDIIYYFLLWILPFILGFAIASKLISIDIIYSILLLITLTLSFLIGLSISFFLSTLYVHSLKLLIGFVLLLLIIGTFFVVYLKIDLFSLLPPLLFFYDRSLSQIIISLVIIIFLSALSIMFMKVEYAEKKRRFKNRLESLSNKFRFSNYSLFIAKDFLDLDRSEGGIGKIIFSFLFPIAIIWIMLYFFLKFVPVNFLLIFSILLGVISSSVYNWLTEFDLFTSYSFLPIKVSTIMKSKLHSYVIINLISVFILAILAIWTDQISYFFHALFMFVSISFYTLSITVYLTGLYPNVLLYNAKIFLIYVLSISPILLILIFLSMFNSSLLFMSILLLLPAFYILRKSYEKWEGWEHPSF
jgi:hypothetical protein